VTGLRQWMGRWEIALGPCRVAEAIRFTERLAEAGIRRRWWKTSLTTYRPVTDSQRYALLAAQQYAAVDLDKHEGRGLLFLGPTGLGKTHLAIGIAREYLQAGRHVLFINVPEFLDALRRAAGSEGDNGDQLMERAFAADLLVLDDMGAEYARRQSESPSWAEERLYLVVNRRYEDMRPVIVTSNCKMPDLPRAMGPRTASRLLAMCDPIVMQGDDTRADGDGGRGRGRPA